MIAVAVASPLEYPPLGARVVNLTGRLVVAARGHEESARAFASAACALPGQALDVATGEARVIAFTVPAGQVLVVSVASAAVHDDAMDAVTWTVSAGGEPLEVAIAEETARRGEARVRALVRAGEPFVIHARNLDPVSPALVRASAHGWIWSPADPSAEALADLIGATP